VDIDETSPNIYVKSLIRSQELGAYTAYLGNVKVLPFKIIQEMLDAEVTVQLPLLSIGKA